MRATIPRGRVPREAAILRSTGDRYFAGWKDGKPVWSAKPWDARMVPDDVATEHIDGPLRSEPGIHAVIYPATARNSDADGA